MRTIDKEIRKYVKKVLRQIRGTWKVKQRIREDLTLSINEKMDNSLSDDVYEVMGDPRVVAEEFMDNLELDSVSDLVIAMKNPYEFISDQKLFGLPLVHINVGGVMATNYAKGIIAIGDAAVGLISIGGVSVGLISFGGVSLGALAIGGVAIGGLAFGGVAIGLYAFGAVSIALYKAFGAVMYLLK